MIFDLSKLLYWGDWKCRSGKCDTGKIAGVENTGADQRGWKCRSKPYGWPTWE